MQNITDKPRVLPQGVQRVPSQVPNTGGKQKLARPNPIDSFVPNKIKQDQSAEEYMAQLATAATSNGKTDLSSLEEIFTDDMTSKINSALQMNESIKKMLYPEGRQLSIQEKKHNDNLATAIDQLKGLQAKLPESGMPSIAEEYSKIPLEFRPALIAPQSNSKLDLGKEGKIPKQAGPTLLKQGEHLPKKKNHHIDIASAVKERRATLIKRAEKNNGGKPATPAQLKQELLKEIEDSKKNIFKSIMVLKETSPGEAIKLSKLIELTEKLKEPSASFDLDEAIEKYLEIYPQKNSEIDPQAPNA